MGSVTLRAPFPYFGGKYAIAQRVWGYLAADVKNYVEPFFGSGAVLLARPQVGKVETVNDRDGFITNFWRAVQRSPEEVAEYADWPVNELDLTARHIWLVNTAREMDLAGRLEADPDFCDPKIAGWWVWGASCWIGGGWCTGRGPWNTDGEKVIKTGDGVSKGRPDLNRVGRGIHAQGVGKRRPHMGRGEGVHSQGVGRQLPHLMPVGKGVHSPLSRGITERFLALSERLRRVRVCCGDWKRVTGPSVTTEHGLTGMFLDPPYRPVGRTAGLYTSDGTDCLNDEVEAFCRERGDDPRMRIVLCGYEGEYDLPGWRVEAWKAHGGYGARGNGMGKENAKRERLWISPHCLTEQNLLLEEADGETER